jgi:DNA-binding IclR family transcriptional regulator
LIDAVIHRYGLPAYTEHTITNPDRLKEHLAQIRAQGYAESDEDIDIHAYSIAVPIYGAEEAIVAAMSVAGPVFRLTPETRPTILRRLATACDHISTQLGARRLPSTMIDWPALQIDSETEEVSLTPGE